MNANKTVTLTVEESKAIAALFTFTDKVTEKAAALAAVIFTADVMADTTGKAYRDARGKCQLWLIQTRALAVESARTEVYRVLNFCGIKAPGKNAGKANGKAEEKTAKEVEASAIVAQGEAAIITALTVALKAHDFSKMRKIVDAAQAAHKAATVAAEPTEA